MTIGQQTTVEGSTALITAIKQRREALVRALLQAGANPNLADAGLQTPLAHALATNQDSITQALRAAGARE
jgi:ankyrin repeat protein